MRPNPGRRLWAAALSVAVVILPLAAAAVCGVTGWRTLVSAVTSADPATALLGTASIGLATALVWAGAAAAAGVVEGWSQYADGVAPAVDAPPLRAATARSRSGALSAAVAALVVAALAAPAAAAAATVDPGRPPAVELVVTGPDGADHTGDGVATVSPDTAPAVAPPLPAGSWGALADDGFRAPRGAPAATAALVTAQPTRTAVAPGAAEVVVVAGDSLWSIAARHLGPGSDDAEVAAAWPRWWEANRATIGEDPHLLLPGQRLVVPTT